MSGVVGALMMAIGTMLALLAGFVSYRHNMVFNTLAVDVLKSLETNGFRASAWRKKGNPSTVEKPPVPALGVRDRPIAFRNVPCDKSRCPLGRTAAISSVPPTFILGHERIIADVVGGYDLPHSVSNAECLHWVRFHTYPGKMWQVLVADICLFASYGMPVYCVVTGDYFGDPIA